MREIQTHWRNAIPFSFSKGHNGGRRSLNKPMMALGKRRLQNIISTCDSHLPPGHPRMQRSAGRADWGGSLWQETSPYSIKDLIMPVEGGRGLNPHMTGPVSLQHRRFPSWEAHGAMTPERSPRRRSSAIL